MALDVDGAEEALRLARALRPHVAGFKVGLQVLHGPGPGTIGALARLDLPVMVDAKLHDIPNTVAAAARRLAGYGARWVTVHALGGPAVLEAAADGLGKGSAGREAGVLAVTVLTSHDDADLGRIGIGATAGGATSRLARLAAGAGAEGVVCSARELGVVSDVAPGLLRVVPGIRPSGSDAGDQARVATPRQALDWGADLLVVGRPITRAPDPVAAASGLAGQLAVE